MLASYDSGEANKMFQLFTRELGVVRAHAQGIRKLSSKLRFALQTYSILQVTLVRGRYGWRITNALPIENVYTELPPPNRYIFLRIVSLIIRLIQGEERDPELYDLTISAYADLKAPLSALERRSLEILTVARILMHLGYLGDSARALLTIEGDDLALPPAIETKLLSHVNKALTSTQL